MKSLLLCLLLVVPVLADSFQDSLSTIQRNTALLVARARPEGVSLTWGQDLAAQDLERLDKAVRAIPSDPGEDVLALAPLVNEMSTAATRVRSTTTLALLDAEGQALALATVDEIKLLQKAVSQARENVEDRLARRYDYGPRFSFGLGFGGWYPYRGWAPWPVIYRPCGVRRCR